MTATSPGACRKPRDLVERLLGLGRADVAVVMRVGPAFEHLEHRFDPGLAQLAMHAHSASMRCHIRMSPWRRARNPYSQAVVMDSGLAPSARPGMTAKS